MLRVRGGLCGAMDERAGLLIQRFRVRVPAEMVAGQVPPLLPVLPGARGARGRGRAPLFLGSPGPPPPPVSLFPSRPCQRRLGPRTQPSRPPPAQTVPGGGVGHGFWDGCEHREAGRPVVLRGPPTLARRVVPGTVGHTEGDLPRRVCGPRVAGQALTPGLGLGVVSGVPGFQHAVVSPVASPSTSTAVTLPGSVDISWGQPGSCSLRPVSSRAPTSISQEPGTPGKTPVCPRLGRQHLPRRREATAGRAVGSGEGAAGRRGHPRAR